MRNIKFIIFASVIFSCSGPKVDFEITNETDKILDSVIITNGIDNEKVTNIFPKQKASLTLEFSEAVKTDGGYGVKIYSDTIVRDYKFGYYSNGLPETSAMIINVSNDTIQVDQ